MYIIYKYTNTINNKCYIGKTNNPEVRHRFHSKADGSSPHFHAAIQKYKFESFERQVLKENILTNEEACTLEIFFIDHFKSQKEGYNIAPGGEGGGHVKYDEELIKEMLLYDRCHRSASEKYNIPFAYVRTLRSNNELYPHLERLPEYKRGFVKKLSEKEVIEILADSSDKYQISEKYGVKPSTIDDIRLGRTWKHLPRNGDVHRKRILHTRTRLIEETVIDILFDSCSHKEAAEKYSIKHSTVCGIRANSLTKWKYIDRSKAPVYVRSIRSG